MTNRTLGAAEIPVGISAQVERVAHRISSGPTGQGEVLMGCGGYVSGSDAAFKLPLSQAPGQRVAQAARRGGGRIDEGLIRRAQQVLETLDADEFEAPLLLAALRGLVMEMWDTACEASEPHQAILAALENAVIIAAGEGGLTPSQLGAFREALSDLGQPHVVSEHATTIRNRLVDEGFTPLAFVSEPVD